VFQELLADGLHLFVFSKPFLRFLEYDLYNGLCLQCMRIFVHQSNLNWQALRIPPMAKIMRLSLRFFLRALF
jgi:hypothetical protein